MEKSKKQKITTEDLAGMVARGFEKSDKRFDELSFELKDIKQQFNKLDFKVDEMYDILKHFEENDILNLQKRVQILEKAVRALASQSAK